MRASEGNGSLDLAVEHASWRADAEILVAKRQKLHQMALDSKATPQEVELHPKATPCHGLSSQRL